MILHYEVIVDARKERYEQTDLEQKSSFTG